jgi:hypothetical protein
MVSRDLLLAAVAGVLSHNLLFIHGEWHMRAPLLFRLYVTLALLVFVAEAVLHAGEIIQTITQSLQIISSYAGALFASILLYRRLFHRLRKFPGPFAASVTKLWHVSKCMDSQNHLLLDGLYKKYGKFVRTGIHTC